MGRTFVRVSLGGVRDEAEVRGHRRTYVGAMAGRIIGAMKTAQVLNPVILLDEIDKMASDFRGDPTAAMLEVLDPEQNHAFTDHYLDAPYDLSKVLFIATANVGSQIPRPLRDRMEIIEVSGYTEAEKVEIGGRHLLPRQLAAHGLPDNAMTVPDPLWTRLVRDYTRESGVRGLERELATLCRKVTREVVRNRVNDRGADGRDEVLPTLPVANDVFPPTAGEVVLDSAPVPELLDGGRLSDTADAGPADAPAGYPGIPFELDMDRLERYLGPKRFGFDQQLGGDQVGVAIGLGTTDIGGEIIPVEVATMPGKGALTITGQAGDVMQESARAALSYARSRAEQLRIPRDFQDRLDLHIHLPEGAMPKDGPSAGITMATAVISALTGRPVRGDTAMTGEITLRGRVLPIGGLKDKSLAAHRTGIRRLIAPADNRRDLVKVPQNIRDDMQFLFVSTMDEVVAAAILLDDEQVERLDAPERQRAPHMPLNDGYDGVGEVHSEG